VEAIENIIGDIRMSKLNGIKRYFYIRERGKEWRLRTKLYFCFCLQGRGFIRKTLKTSKICERLLEAFYAPLPELFPYS